MLLAAMIAAALMLLTRCVSIERARKSLDWEVLLAIAASFALGTALEKSGAARMIADSTASLSGGNAWLALG
ncbi:MAG: SLC13 family permease, partial [Planctomycetia bacterium]|nr:SLC13 family permease [Planctomycetia bacterium]